MAHLSVASENPRIARHYSEGSSERAPVRGKPGQGVPSKQAAADPRLRLDRTDASIVAIRQITIAPIDTPRHSPLVQWPDTFSDSDPSSPHRHSGSAIARRRGTDARGDLGVTSARPRSRGIASLASCGRRAAGIDRSRFTAPADADSRTGTGTAAAAAAVRWVQPCASPLPQHKDFA